MTQASPSAEDSTGSTASDIRAANIKTDARVEYARRRDLCQSEIDRLKSNHLRLVWIRSVLFVVAVITLFFGYGGQSFNAPLLITGWISAAGFLVAIVRHEHVRLTRLRLRSDQELYEHLLARLSRSWDNIPEQPPAPAVKNLAYADDLDITGPASLISLLSLTWTFPGRQTLQGWLAFPADWSDVIRRQCAVKTLRPLRDLRLEIIQTVRSTGSSTLFEYGLPEWATGPNWLPTHRLPHLLSYLGPFIVFASLGTLGYAFANEDRWLINAAAIGLGVGFLLNIIVTVLWGSWIHDIFQKVTGEHRAAYKFAVVFEAMSQLPADSTGQGGTLTESGEHRNDCDRGLLDDIRYQACESDGNALIGFTRLMRIVRFANLQRDPVLYVLYLLLQLFVLWDFRILKLLEKWKSRFGSHVGDWFNALGTLEAVISGATLSDEYPEWCFPEPLSQPEVNLITQDLGHPLLSDEERVANSLQLDSARPLIVVTGSNMAGKSTFLRAVGLNVVLARTGAPVCATTLQLPVYELATSIRIRDSLSDGVSFFMAELNRLKEVVDLAETYHQRRTSDEHSARILFLLDEILQGTNSQERQIAVTTVLQQLLTSQATGLISTHDLDLAHVDEISQVSQVVHFREYFEAVDGKEVMRFDYRMRPGPTPTTNALKLLQLVGLKKQSDDNSENN